MPPSFDYHANGRVFLQDGTIYYSPNSKRSVMIPHPEHTGSPFEQRRLDVSLFKQPVHWSDSWGWLSFVPLSPSFLSAPFEPFCSMPTIHAITRFAESASGQTDLQYRYKLSDDKIDTWKKYEDLILNAAQLTRLRYKIPGTTPPQPSSFHFDRSHKSHGIAKRMACVAREWLAIWMGFLSYIIAQTEIQSPNAYPDMTSPLPDWYTYLQFQHQYSEFWLDGLLLSTVCQFTSDTPRAGLVYPWADEITLRPSIDWFYDHGIPLWFVWTSREERKIEIDYSYSYLRPPTDLVQDALTLLFDVPSLPLAGLIMKKYFHLGNDPITNDTIDFLRVQHAPSAVFEFTAFIFVNQRGFIRRTEPTASKALMELRTSRQAESRANAEAEASFPYEGLLAISAEDGGHLYANVEEFLLARERRQAEMIKAESAVDKQKRLSREKQPAVVNARIFVWEKVGTAGGGECFRRVKVPKKENEDVFAEFQPCQRLYNAFSNEWDLCESFRFGDYDPGYDNDTQYEDDYPNGFDDDSHYVPNERAKSPQVVEDELVLKAPHFSRDVFETMNLTYGYYSLLGATPPSPSSHTWESILGFLGFVTNLSDLSVPRNDELGIKHFFVNLLQQSLTLELDDLNSKHHLSVPRLFDFSSMQRPADDLFVFHSPKSNAVRWILGVHSPSVAVYVCRYILSNPQYHTVLTVAHHLLVRGIPFRTLLPLDCSSRVSSICKAYSPSVYRFFDHQFTSADFDAAMLHCQSILSLPQGRAALLQGGILGRIAKQYLGLDGVLNGPSSEVVNHRVGYICPSGFGETALCDDKLTENEIAIICGTYSLYTATQGQVAVWSWFPPPSVWDTHRCGTRWLDWTERCETIFQNILDGIRSGKIKPKPVSGWVTFLRGQKVSRNLFDINNARAKKFMNDILPFPSTS